LNLVPVYLNPINIAKDLSNRMFALPRHEDMKPFTKLFFLRVLVALWLIFSIYPSRDEVPILFEISPKPSYLRWKYGLPAKYCHRPLLR